MKKMNLEQMQHVQGGTAEQAVNVACIAATLLTMNPLVGAFCLGWAIATL